MPRLDQLKLLRRRRVLTQHELADRAGVSRAAIARIETGQANARPATIRKLASALHIEPGELAGARADAAGILAADPELTALVEEAAAQLRERMPGTRLTLRVERDPEYGDDEQIVLGISPGSADLDAIEALRRFDREWWVTRVAAARGRLCIDLLDE